MTIPTQTLMLFAQNHRHVMAPNKQAHLFLLEVMHPWDVVVEVEVEASVVAHLRITRWVVLKI
jgi:hypothetical protein